jgi:heptosyltransferase-1
MNILIVKTSSLGDVIHMLPAITDAARAIPNLQVDWLVEESFAAIPAWHPAVRKVIPIAMRRWKKHLGAKQTWQEIKTARQAIKTCTYDLVLDSQGLLKSALWTPAAQGPSAGYDRSSIREPLASWFYDHKYSVPRQLHATERNRQLTAQALGYTASQTAPEYGLQGLAARLPSPGFTMSPGSIIGLHGTSRDDKLWPTHCWIDLAHALAQTKRPLLLPWGNEAERLRANHIASQAGNARVLPKLGLNALASLIDQAQAVVGVDTGLLHLAAALGKPGLALYTATPPELTGALSDKNAAQALQNLSDPQELESAFVSRTLLQILHTSPAQHP